MSDLGPILARLGLDQYLDALIGEGFDTWDTVLDITESDLDALNFKLGHRRKLQREIANYRGISYERSLGSPTHEAASDSSKAGESDVTLSAFQTERKPSGGADGKRKYRRHPKPDESAPERPPSAYVIFSNKVREDVKGQSFSFTDIAKLVGERWQMLPPVRKEPFETQAAAAKERYLSELAEYKKTDNYRDYMHYLADFRARHGSTTTEGKRPRLEKESSSMSNLSAGSLKPGDSADSATLMPRQKRGTSVSSASHPSSLSSPSSGVPLSFNHGPGATIGGPGQGASSDNNSPSPFMGSRGGIFNAPVASRPALPYEFSSEVHTMATPLAAGSIADARDPLSYQGYIQNFPTETHGTTTRRPTRLPVPLLHQETSTSRSSLSSGISSSSGGSVPGVPATPGDDSWIQRSNLAQMSKAAVEISNTGTEYSRSMHPPFSGQVGAPYPVLPPLRIADRVHESVSPTAETQRVDSYLRSLPPPHVATVPTATPPTESDPRRFLRSHSSDPGASQKIESHPDQPHRISAPSRSLAESDDPLAVLAYAGKFLDGQTRDPAP